MTSGREPERSILDASALMAYLRGEPGSAVVEAGVRAALVSSLNWSETLQKMIFRGANVSGLLDDLQEIGLNVVPFDAIDAHSAAELWRPRGNLSLADRACLALGRRLRLPVLTTDREWVDLNVGVEVRLIR